MDDAQDESRPIDGSTNVDIGRPPTESVWDRVFDGPPINPRSELIYHDGKPLRARHRS